MALTVRFAPHVDPQSSATLAALRFGASHQADIEMPSLDSADWWEIWESDRPVVRHAMPFPMADDGEFLFGAVSAMDGDDVTAVTERLYATMLDAVAGTPFKRLLRVWHYIPRITQIIPNGERYHLFNQGRRQALDRFPEYAVPPAASALGSDGGKLTLMFVAARETGIAIENPRQIAAYQYPPQYGPRPLFSRAMLFPGVFFISGTASILGHESRHIGDVAAQTDEMIRNLQALCDEARRKGNMPERFAIKAYIRRADDAGMVRDALAKAFSGSSIVCLRADICREDLLVEAEVTAF